jgi:hypothetical protein
MCLQDRRRYDLGDPFAPHYGKILTAQIGEDHLYLTAIVAVDGAGCVEAGDAVLERKAGARADLHFVPVRNGDCEPGCDGMPLAGPQGEAFRRYHVQPRRLPACISGEGQSLAVGESFHLDLDCLHAVRGTCHGSGPATASRRRLCSGTV